MKCTLRFWIVFVLIVSELSRVQAQVACDFVTFSVSESGEVLVNGISGDGTYAIYTYDIEERLYTIHCNTDCGSSQIVNPSDNDDVILVYRDGLNCKSITINDLVPPSGSCLVGLSNSICRPVDVYAIDDLRFIATLEGMTHPFSPPPSVPGERVVDSVPLAEWDTRSYVYFNVGKNLSTALPLANFQVDCSDNTELKIEGGCSDAVGLNVFTNIGCRVLSLFTSEGAMDPLAPGESVDLRGDGVGFNTYQFSVDEEVILGGTYSIQGLQDIVLLDSGGVRDSIGNCTDLDIPEPLDCSEVSISYDSDTVKFDGLNTTAMVQTYIYNLTQGIYAYHCSQNCSTESEVAAQLGSDRYLLGVNYYDASGALVCFVTDEVN